MVSYTAFVVMRGQVEALLFPNSNRRDAKSRIDYGNARVEGREPTVI